MLPPVLPEGELSQRATSRERQPSFEDTLKAKSVEFEEGRLNTAPPLDVMPVNQVQSVATGSGSPAPLVVATSFGSPAPPASRAILVRRPAVIAEIAVPNHEHASTIVLAGKGSTYVDPYANMYYDAYGSPVKGKGFIV